MASGLVPKTDITLSLLTFFLAFFRGAGVAVRDMDALVIAEHEKPHAHGNGEGDDGNNYPDRP